MAFSVIPESIDNCASSIQGLADVTGYGDICAAVSGKDYIREYIQVGFLGVSGVFAAAGGITDDIRSSLLGVLSNIGSALDSSADELRKTANNYAVIDDNARKTLDRAYPDSGVGQSAPVYVCKAKPRLPRHLLNEPQDAPPVDLMAAIWTENWASPTEIVAFIIDRVCGFNFYDELAKRFTGDWGSLEKVSSALKQLADFHVAVGRSADQELSDLMGDWSGEAADAAASYFSKFAGATDTVGETVEKLSQVYITMAIGMAAAGDIVAGLMARLMDSILYAAVSYLAAEATAGTIVGGIAFGALSLMELGQCFSIFNLIIAAIGDVTTKWDVFAGGVGIAQMLIVESSPAFKVPGGYDNPQV